MSSATETTPAKKQAKQAGKKKAEAPYVKPVNLKSAAVALAAERAGGKIVVLGVGSSADLAELKAKAKDEVLKAGKSKFSAVHVTRGGRQVYSKKIPTQDQVERAKQAEERRLEAIAAKEKAEAEVKAKEAEEAKARAEEAEKAAGKES